MANLPIGNEGALNGTTPVTIVAAPASSTQRLVRSVTICNRDTAAVVITVSKNKGGTLYRVISALTLAVGETLTLGDSGELFVLDATNESMEAVMAGAAATTNPDYTASYLDVT